LIHFSASPFQTKLNKYPFVNHPAPEVFIAIPKKVTTVMRAKTKVVFKSLFIGLIYSKIFPEIDEPSQSITSQNIFPNNIMMKKPAIKGNAALENFLSQ